MNKRYKLMALILFLLLAFLVVAEALQPKPVNWFPSYSALDKIPFGTYVFYEELEKTLPENRLENITVPPFEFILEEPDNGTYFFLNNSVNFDKAELKNVLEWTGKGNTLFISAKQISKGLLDTLNLSMRVFTSNTDLKKRPLVNFTNPKLKSNLPYRLDKDVTTTYFDKIDTASTRVLGVFDLIRDNDSSSIQEPKVNFISNPFEKGTVILHTFPEGFTNYFILDSINSGYAGKALSYLPKNGKIFMDHHYKSGKAMATSPLYLIFSNRYLKWAWYTILILALFWVYFEGKRKQRSIPVVKPLPNQTLDFTRTIAGMYLDKKDNRQIALHQINHFMEYLRNRYSISTAKRDSNFIEQIAAKSGQPREEVKKLIDYIITIRQKAVLSEDELIQLNRLIEKFKTNT